MKVQLLFVFSTMIQFSLGNHMLEAGLKMMYKDKCSSEADGCNSQSCSNMFLGVANMAGMKIKPLDQTQMFQEMAEICHSYYVSKLMASIMAVGGEMAAKSLKMMQEMGGSMPDMSSADQNGELDRSLIAEKCFFLLTASQSKMIDTMVGKFMQMKETGLNPIQLLGEDGKTDLEKLGKTMQCARALAENLATEGGLQEIVGMVQQAKDEAVSLDPKMEEFVQAVMGGSNLYTEEASSMEECFGTLLDNAQFMQDHIKVMTGEKESKKPGSDQNSADKASEMRQKAEVCGTLFMNVTMERVSSTGYRGQRTVSTWKRNIQRYGKINFDQQVTSLGISNPNSQVMECFQGWQMVKTLLGEYIKELTKSCARPDRSTLSTRDISLVEECGNLMIEKALVFKSLWDPATMTKTNSRRSDTSCMNSLLSKMSKGFKTLEKAMEVLKDHPMLKKKAGVISSQQMLKPKSNDESCGLCTDASPADFLFPALLQIQEGMMGNEVIVGHRRRKRQMVDPISEGLCEACSAFIYDLGGDMGNNAQGLMEEKCCTIWHACDDVMMAYCLVGKHR